MAIVVDSAHVQLIKLLQQSGLSAQEAERTAAFMEKVGEQSGNLQDLIKSVQDSIEMQGVNSAAAGILKMSRRTTRSQPDNESGSQFLDRWAKGFRAQENDKKKTGSKSTPQTGKKPAGEPDDLYSELKKRLGQNG